MPQTILFLLVVALSGVYASRWMLRLAPLGNELPLKTVAATALGALVVAAFFAVVSLPEALEVAALVLVPLYIFGPLALIALARGRRYGGARGLANALYWTQGGREAVGRLLAQVALQRGDAEAALALLPERAESDLLRVQAYAQQGRWRDLLELTPPEGGDNAFLAHAARAQAYLELGETNLAEFELTTMEERWEGQGQGPLGYRAVTLTKARLAASRGNFEEARTLLQEPLPGVPPYVVLGILALAAERSGRLEPASRLYAQAYQTAPEGQRTGLAGKLTSYGQPLPKVAREKPRRRVTFALMAVIALCYGVQLWLDQNYTAGGIRTAAFLHNVPGVPEADALWRYLSYGFVHGNLVHIGFNLWVLFDIGRLYEARRDPGNLLAAFVVGTILGAYFTTIATAGGVPLVGASGGVLGVAGALLADTLRSQGAQDRLLTRALLQWIVLIALFSLLPGVSLWGHAGGLVGGLLWGFVRQGLPASKRIDWVAGGLSVALIVYALVSAGGWAVRYL